MTSPQQQVTAVALATASRQVQADLTRQMLGDVAQTWPLLNPKRLNETWPTWLRVMSALLGRYHRRAAEAASAYYRAERARELGDPGTVELAGAPSDQWVTKALAFAGPGKIDAHVKAGSSEQQAAQKAFTVVTGTAQRVMLDGQRMTVMMAAEQDRRDAHSAAAKARWYRLTDGNPCPWCALLASRGAIYRSNQTVSFNRSGRFENTSEFGGHNDCGCTAAVTFAPEEHKLSAVAQLADNIYFGTDERYLDDRDRSVADMPNSKRLTEFRRLWAQYGPSTEQPAAAA